MTAVRDLRLNDRMLSALRTGAEAWDRSLSGYDLRTYGALHSRGLVEYRLGTDSYYSPRKGWWVTRQIVTDVKITEKGLAALAELDGGK